MINKADGLQKIKELVTRFNEQLPAYKKADYNETQTRRDFIDPFFKALGWDIDNEQGAAESYREVIHEDKVKVGKATKAPDYSFRLGGGQRLFFVEAKKPSILIKDDIQPAYQVRRYGWSAKLSVSVITDFEEFAIYDCTKKPNPADKTSVARVKYFTFNEYENEWDFLWSTFSKEAVLKGSFDKFIGSNANKKGTATVDKAFLTSLDEWRTLLAETISKENKQLDEDELNFVVQQTLDRIIFLRICEDRSIEPYGSLQASLKTGDYYQNLLKEFKQADDKYNSGLFDFKKDTLSKQLAVNNKTLKTIINQLYYPECPYEFSVLSVEILGSAYEQFLGKTITINNRGKAVIELKPEVRKAGGVYYTPQYIVDYIVQNTIGKLVENKTPNEVAAIKIVDPACGSGSFLIGAYQFLLNWHIDYYTKNPKEAAKAKALVSNTNEGAGIRLSTSLKKQILLNNIYGVDIDTNAVEVTKLSLLLKCMEGETQASIAHQMTMFKERVLPKLENNIKSGNSLIDTDYYDNQLDFGEERKIKPFNWQKAFPEVFKIKKEKGFLQIVNEYKKVIAQKENLDILNNKLIELYPKLKNEHKSAAEIIKYLEVEFKQEILIGIKTVIEEIENPLVNVPETYLELFQNTDATLKNVVINNYDDFINSVIETLLVIKKSVAPNNNAFAYFELLTLNVDVVQRICTNKKIDFTRLYTALVAKFIQHLQDNFDSYENFYLQNATEKNGGFDVVIGNPPYVMMQNLETKNTFNYTLNKYKSAKYKIDTYQIFIEAGLKLLNPIGKLGFIVPNTFLKNIHSEPLRKYILDNSYISEIVLFDYSVFADASVDTSILLLDRNKTNINLKTVITKVLIEFDPKLFTTISQSEFQKNEKLNFNFNINSAEKNLLNKIVSKSNPLGEYCDAYFGIQTFDRKKFVSVKKENKFYKPIIDGSNIQYYFLKDPIEYVNFIPEAIKSGGNEKVYTQDKICVRQIGNVPIATFVPANIFGLNTLYSIYPKNGCQKNLKFLLAIINSNCSKFYWKKYNSDEKKTFPKIKKDAILSIRIPKTEEIKLDEIIVNYVDQLLHLNKDLQTANLETKKEQIKQKIEYNENKINTLVYSLYNLTEEEIKIIEGN